MSATLTVEVAEQMCDRIGIVYRGKIVAQGTMAELREQTASGDGSLEAIFLKLTGGSGLQEIATIHRRSIEPARPLQAVNYAPWHHSSGERRESRKCV